MTAVHPDHEAVAAEVARWYTVWTPEPGREVGESWYGYHRNLSPDTARVVLRTSEPAQVSAALGEARSASGSRTLRIWVDDRHRAAQLDSALRDYGCRIGDATTHLALVGSLQSRAGPEDLVIENVDEAGYTDWATIKLQAFDDSESAPAPDRLASEIATRTNERAIAECRVGLLGGEKVAILAYYHGTDQMVFNLAARHSCIAGSASPTRFIGIRRTNSARRDNTGVLVDRSLRSCAITASESAFPPAKRTTPCPLGTPRASVSCHGWPD